MIVQLKTSKLVQFEFTKQMFMELVVRSSAADRPITLASRVVE